MSIPIRMILMYPDAWGRRCFGTCSRDKNPLSPKRDTAVSTTVVRNPSRNVPAAAFLSRSFLSEALGDNDGKAVGQTLQKADEQCTDGSCCSHSGQRGFTECASHDPCVSQTVKKLEQIAQTYGKSKGKHEFGRVSLSQILHNFYSPMIIFLKILYHNITRPENSKF